MAIRPFEKKIPRLAEAVYIDETALVQGDVVIGVDSSVWPFVSIRGDVHHIQIGARTNIQDNSVLHVTHVGEFSATGSPLIIGDAVTIGHQVLLHGCTIENTCLIGMGSLVLDGAVIQAGAMVGAGSLVPMNKQVEGGYLWIGRPVKKVRPLTEEEKTFLNYSADHYVRLKNRHKAR